ncbi:hypothetical protein DKT69_20970 [Micromonospora sicca]|uniref:Uncharacterized protein n=2 Tax=Micromonospora TaxID=1873 RepID=A0A317DKD5_9ACTN|nr:hypothetical protein [Micromonospora sp. 4G51]PWR13395.1 hypothetical protein DKT69_20970 [Micromonospora sp. 4G51]
MLETLGELRDTVRAEPQPGRKVKLARAYIDALGRAAELNHLADELELGAVGLRQALRVVRGAALALMEVYDEFSMVRNPGKKVNGHPLAPRVLDLAVDVNNLERPIRRLFEPSDDMVDALR